MSGKIELPLAEDWVVGRADGGKRTKFSARRDEMPISSHQGQVEVSRFSVASSFSFRIVSHLNKYSSKRQSREIDGAVA